MIRRWFVLTIAALLLVAATNTLEAQDTVPPTLISIPGGTVPHSGTIQLNITGNTFPKGLAGFQIRVTTAKPEIAIPILFTSPDYGLTNLNDTEPNVLVLGAVDLNELVEVGAENIVLGTVRFEGLQQGVTAITLEVLKMDDEDGSPILVSEGMGVLMVSNSRDLDGDGLTEDINGNGFFDFDDVIVLFKMLLAVP